MHASFVTRGACKKLHAVVVGVFLQFGGLAKAPFFVDRRQYWGFEDSFLDELLWVWAGAKKQKKKTFSFLKLANRSQSPMCESLILDHFAALCGVVSTRSKSSISMILVRKRVRAHTDIFKCRPISMK